MVPFAGYDMPLVYSDASQGLYPSTFHTRGFLMPL